MSICEQSKMQFNDKLAFFICLLHSWFLEAWFLNGLTMEHAKPRTHHVTEKVQAYLVGPGINLAQERTSKQSYIIIGKHVINKLDKRIRRYKNSNIHR